MRNNNVQQNKSLNKKDTNTVAKGQATHYDPSHRESTKRKVPVQQNASRKLSEQEDQQKQGNKSKHQVGSDAVVIKNSDLQQLKEGFRSAAQEKVQEESIFNLGSQAQNYNELSGLNLQRQQTMPQQPLKQSRLEENVDQSIKQTSMVAPEAKNYALDSANKQIFQTQQGFHPYKNVHHFSIVGQNISTIDQTDPYKNNKELQQKMYQDELQRQIRERDEIRKKEQDSGVSRRPPSLNRKVVPETSQNQQQFPWDQRAAALEEQRQQQQQQQVSIDNRQMPSNNLNMEKTFSSKMDFPTIMTRAKVVDGRTDLELESKGTIFQGRDEKQILIKKKEDQQQAMKDALQKQIDEKNRKKEEEKQKLLQRDMMDDQRYRQEYEKEQQQQPSKELMGGRRTMYNNQHQHSIVGSGAGQEFKLPEIDAVKSPQLSQQQPTKQQMSIVQEEQEENIYAHMNQSSNQAPKTNETMAHNHQDPEEVDSKNKQINELSDMVKILLEEQKNLKAKLESQEVKITDINQKPPGGQPQALHQRKHTAVNNKKASERVRSQNPPKKTVQSADNKTLQQRKIKEQHAIEQAKLEAIENKINNARKRIEDTKKGKSSKAIETRIKVGGNQGSNDDNLNEYLYGNEDLDDVLAHQQQLISQQHVPVIGGRHKNNSGIGDRSHQQLSTAPPINQKIQANAINQNKSVPISQGHDNSRGISSDGPGRNQKMNSKVGQKSISNKVSASSVLPSQNNLHSLVNDHTAGVGRYKVSAAAKTEMNSISHSEHTPSKGNPKANRSKVEGVFNLDNEGVSQLTYPNEVGEFFHPQITGTGFMKYSPGGPGETHYDANAYRVPSTTTSQQNYNVPYDPNNYNVFSQQKQNRQKQASHFDLDQSSELQASREFIGGIGGMGPGRSDFISKNPSTAAVSYMPGGLTGFGAGLTSGGGLGLGQIPNESFDLDIMMPPDIDAIESDINKLGALTPNPINNNLGWGGFEQHMGYNPHDYSGGGGGGLNQYSMKQSYNQMGQMPLQMGGIPQVSAFDDSQSIYDSKYSPSRGGYGDFARY